MMLLEYVKKFAKSFGATYDFLSKIAKLGLFIFAIILLFKYWHFVDWNRTGSDLIAKRTPFQLQDPNVPKEARNPVPGGTTEERPSTASNTPPPSKQKQTSQRTTQSSKQHSRAAPTRDPAAETKQQEEVAQPPAVDYLNIYQYGQLIFTVDKPYDTNGDIIVFDKLLLKGKPDYNHPFAYAGREIMITNIREYIGLLVSGGSVEGPVLRGVRSKIIGQTR